MAAANHIYRKISFRLPGSGAEVRTDFNEKWFEADSAMYNHSIARFCAVYSMAGYYMPAPGSKSPECGALTALRALGTEKEVICSGTGRNEVDYLIAKKKITACEKEYSLIICAALGSHHGQWYENFDAGTGKLHRGFKSASDFVFEKLKKFCKENGAEKENTKLLLTGHSRGGAAAYLLAARLADSKDIAYKENIFTYTFAAPNSVSSDIADNEKYSRIFNFVNDEDFVTKCMPEKWGYHRFGKTLALPLSGKELKKTESNFFRYSGGREFAAFPKRTETVDSLFDSLCAEVWSIDEYYNKKLPFFGKNISAFEYFSSSVCAVTGEDAGTKGNKDGTAMLIKTSLLRPACHRVFRKISDFFVFYEGIGGATGGKISNTYFSFAHDICTYCSALEASEEKMIIFRN